MKTTPHKLIWKASQPYLIIGSIAVLTLCSLGFLYLGQFAKHRDKRLASVKQRTSPA